MSTSRACTFAHQRNPSRGGKNMLFSYMFTRFTCFLGVEIPTRHVFLLLKKRFPPRTAIVPGSTSCFHSVLANCPTQLFFNCENRMLRQIGFVAHASPIENSWLFRVSVFGSLVCFSFARGWFWNPLASFSVHND